MTTINGKKLAFLREKNTYERLGKFIVHLIRDDPSAPKNHFHTIFYRLKDETRLIEKIDKENKNLPGKASSVTTKNFQERIGDLLGIRLVSCQASSVVSCLSFWLPGFVAQSVT
ncbi:MAG: hypothetical protein N839_0002670 [Desulfofustis sp. PB-SRB1]|nr:hypothetical protein [Desulfofustis sp. PB-SRB1]MBM1001295.1 hypothetical protein [Desulfofustis sp. PB-SRB1]